MRSGRGSERRRILAAEKRPCPIDETKDIIAVVVEAEVEVELVVLVVVVVVVVVVAIAVAVVAVVVAVVHIEAHSVDCFTKEGS